MRPEAGRCGNDVPPHVFGEPIKDGLSFLTVTVKEREQEQGDAHGAEIPVSIFFGGGR